MRKSTLLWLVLAMLTGITLFHTSQKVHDRHEKMTALDAAIGREEESLRVLRAEWSYLTQPDRLEKLANAHLHLVPMKGSQFARLEEIPLRPPAAEIPAAAAETTPPEISQPEISLAAEPEEAKEPAAAAVKIEPVRINRPVPPPVVLAAPAPAPAPAPVAAPRPSRVSAAPAPARRFDDVMKSLGVE